MCSHDSCRDGLQVGSARWSAAVDGLCHERQFETVKSHDKVDVRATRLVITAELVCVLIVATQHGG